MNIVHAAHSNYVHGRRVKVLAGHIETIMGRKARILDVGCGDGQLAYLVAQARPDLEIHGIDSSPRNNSYTRVEGFDGMTIPYDRGVFDVVMLVDVLHHLDDPMRLLREAARVAGSTVVIKDHLLEGVFARPTLCAMDYLGNRRYAVPLPYNYWTRQQWVDNFRELDLRIKIWNENLQIYPRIANWIFGRSLHFLVKLERV